MQAFDKQVWVSHDNPFILSSGGDELSNFGATGCCQLY